MVRVDGPGFGTLHTGASALGHPVQRVPATVVASTGGHGSASLAGSIAEGPVQIPSVDGWARMVWVLRAHPAFHCVVTFEIVTFVRGTP